MLPFNVSGIEVGVGKSAIVYSVFFAKLSQINRTQIVIVIKIMYQQNTNGTVFIVCVCVCLCWIVLSHCELF